MIAVDVSGSMSGSRAKHAYQATVDIYNSLDKDDGFGIITFSDKFQSILPLKKKHALNFPACISQHLDTARDGTVEFSCDGGTKVWDAVYEAMTMLNRRVQGGSHPKPSHPMLILISDGDDVNSSHTVEQVKETLAQPGDFAKQNGKEGKNFAFFSCHLVSVGDRTSSHAQHFDDIQKHKPKLIHHHNAASAADIGKCFTTIQKVILTREVITPQVAINLSATKTSSVITPAHIAKSKKQP